MFLLTNDFSAADLVHAGVKDREYMYCCQPKIYLIGNCTDIDPGFHTCHALKKDRQQKQINCKHGENGIEIIDLKSNGPELIESYSRLAFQDVL